jgi:tetrahydromethanopterin S-methyltransferase subunit G
VSVGLSETNLCGDKVVTIKTVFDESKFTTAEDILQALDRLLLQHPIPHSKHKRNSYTIMSFTLEQRYQILTALNEALLRTDQMRSQYADAPNDFYSFDATLTPTEYQKNRPVPLLFQEEDIWQRLDKIEQRSEFLVNQVLQIIADFKTVERAIVNERSSVNSALKRADVLEWETGSRSVGMFAQRDDLIEKLRYQLGLPPSPDSMGGGGILLRS